MTALRTALLLLFVCYCRASGGECDSDVDPKHFIVIPDNVECLATVLSPDATIKETVIHFGPGLAGEIILRVPIETPDSAIVITLGIDNSHYNTYDATLRIGVTDLSRSLYFDVIDVKQYRRWPPCYPIAAISDENRVSEGTKVPSTFKFTLLLKDSFGFCETAQEGGYINVGKFSNELNLSRPLYLQLVNWIEREEHFIHYISIESK